MKIAKDEKDIIIKMFPELAFNGNLLQGRLQFAAQFLEVQRAYELLNPNSDAPIKGSFQISIDFSKPNPYREVYETGGRIKEIASKLGKTLLDLHAKQLNESDPVNVCIAGYLQEEKDIELKRFICEIVVPYFCDLVIYEKSGGKLWLRGEWSHGISGLLEEYEEYIALEPKRESEFTEKCLSELKALDKDFDQGLRKLLVIKGKLRGHWPIEQNKKLRDLFGRKGFNGLWKLKNNLKKYNLTF